MSLRLRKRSRRCLAFPGKPHALDQRKDFLTRRQAKVFTGSKWDRRKRKPTPTSKPKMNFGGVLDAFEEMNDVEAVAIFDERARMESIMAEETARRLEQMRKAEIRAAMDAEQVPSRLRKVRLLHGRRERTCACADRWCCAGVRSNSRPKQATWRPSSWHSGRSTLILSYLRGSCPPRSPRCFRRRCPRTSLVSSR